MAIAIPAGLTAEQLRKWFRERWKKAFGEYDGLGNYEKIELVLE